MQQTFVLRTQKKCAKKAATSLQVRRKKSLFLNLSFCCLETGLKPFLFMIAIVQIAGLQCVSEISSLKSSTILSMLSFLNNSTKTGFDIKHVFLYQLQN
jgi:hypothetical protein